MGQGVFWTKFVWRVLRGKLMSSNEIFWGGGGGGQAETQRWALRWCPKAFGVVISLSKQVIKVAPWQEQYQGPIKTS